VPRQPAPTTPRPTSALALRRTPSLDPTACPKDLDPQLHLGRDGSPRAFDPSANYSIPIAGRERLSTTDCIGNTPAPPLHCSPTLVRRRTADTVLMCSRQESAPGPAPPSLRVARHAEKSARHSNRRDGDSSKCRPIGHLESVRDRANCTQTIVVLRTASFPSSWYSSRGINVAPPTLITRHK
jgi:hypothetical protein